MNNTKIEYLDKTWNFLTGCNNWKDQTICGGGSPEFKCWAKSMANRFGRDFTPRYNRDAFVASFPKEPSRIGVCFTGDLFQNDVDPEMGIGVHSADSSRATLRDIALGRIENNPKHQFFFLTKCPWNLSKWGKFPDNSWVGVSVCHWWQFERACKELSKVEAKHKWISFEPLLGMMPWISRHYLENVGIDWVVIGGLSGSKKISEDAISAIRDIIHAAVGAKVPVWLKDNLKWIAQSRENDLPHYLQLWRNGLLKQELPDGVHGVVKA